MGTRGAIGIWQSPDSPYVELVGSNKNWKARYHNWDSYPEGLGKTLWDLYHSHFKKVLGQMIQTLIFDHTSWSTIVGRDWSISPEYKIGWMGIPGDQPSPIEDGTVYTKHRAPVCYCHGERPEPGFWIDEEDSNSCEYAYIFDVDNNTMTVFEKSSYGWVEGAIVNLDGEEPNWGNLLGVEDEF